MNKFFIEKRKCKKYSEILFEWVKNKTPLESSLLFWDFFFFFFPNFVVQLKVL